MRESYHQMFDFLENGYVKAKSYPA